jgi:hypothetical protein
MSVDDNFVIQCGGNRPTQMKDQGPGGSMVLSGPGPICYLRYGIKAAIWAGLALKDWSAAFWLLGT